MKKLYLTKKMIDENLRFKSHLFLPLSDFKTAINEWSLNNFENKLYNAGYENEAMNLLEKIIVKFKRLGYIDIEYGQNTRYYITHLGYNELSI